MSESKRPTRKDDPTDVDALTKGKSKEKGKKDKDQNHMSNVKRWNCGKYREQDEEHVDGWWKTTDWQAGSSSEWWMTANDQKTGETEEPTGGFEINSTERFCSKCVRKGREQDRKWTDRFIEMR